MYQYDSFDETIVRQRADDFRDQVDRRLTGELSEDQFRPLRLMNGLYLQLHAYMLRVAVPYGTLSSTQMRKLAHIARTYDKGYGHFTTRQNIQYNWPKLRDVPDILHELADVEMHAIQTSGNCIRNTTTDQFAGVAADELMDPRPYCELIRQWSTFHPEFAFLPRKFKIAVTASEQDRAAIKFHDIGIQVIQNEAGETGFRMIAGGGMGRTPFVGPVVREFLPEEHLLSYLEAMLRVYNEWGRRDNKYKARIKILVFEQGVDWYRERVEEEWERIKDGALAVPAGELDRIRSFFTPPAYEKLFGACEAYEAALLENPAFADWARASISGHKISGYSIVTISLKPHGGIPGDATDVQMDAVADLADQYSFGEIRVTHEQNLVLPNVKESDLYALWQALDAQGLAAPNAGLLTDMIACPGLDYCALANARSIPIAQKIQDRFDDIKRLREIGDLKIKISGCINACGHHHAGHIGILGVDRKGEELYQLVLGGSGAEDASIGKITGRGFTEDGIVDAIETTVETYLEHRQEGESFLTAYRRMGMEPFKEALYGTH